MQKFAYHFYPVYTRNYNKLKEHFFFVLLQQLTVPHPSIYVCMYVAAYDNERYSYMYFNPDYPSQITELSLSYLR